MNIQIKKKIITYLLASAIILLFINVGLEMLKKPAKISNVSKELSERQIDSVFISVMDDYGIQNDWITAKKLNMPLEDSISKQYIVRLPSDLSIPLIIKDVNHFIENDITGFVSEEKKVFGTTEMRIYSNEMLKLKATLIPDSSKIRRRSKLSFIIADAFDLGSPEFNSFLAVPYRLTAAVVPTQANIVKADSLKKYSKEYIVFINNSMNEKKFKLESGDQKALLRNSINNIVSNFGNAVLYSIDEKSELYNSILFNYVRDEFKKRNVRLVLSSEFIQLHPKDDADLISKFKFYCDDKEAPEQKVFLISFENFRKLDGELIKFRKKGNKVLPLSSIDLSSIKAVN